MDGKQRSGSETAGLPKKRDAHLKLGVKRLKDWLLKMAAGNTESTRRHQQVCSSAVSVAAGWLL